jgi:hypothetical protein
MRIQREHFFQKNPSSLAAPKQSEGGMATMIFIVLLAIMMILVTAESSALFHLHREVRFLEQQQIKRLNASQTNSFAVTKPDSK